MQKNFSCLSTTSHFRWRFDEYLTWNYVQLLKPNYSYFEIEILPRILTSNSQQVNKLDANFRFLRTHFMFFISSIFIWIAFILCITQSIDKPNNHCKLHSFCVKHPDSDGGNLKCDAQSTISHIQPAASNRARQNFHPGEIVCFRSSYWWGMWSDDIRVNWKIFFVSICHQKLHSKKWKK